MSEATGSARSRSPWLTTAAWQGLLRDRPIIPLLGLLALLVVLREVARPGIISADFLGVTLRAAVPLAILAGCQTLTMLTGGIDLSVGAVASMAGFLVATLVGGPGLGAAILVALAAATLAGLISGIGVGVFRVHPLIMTLGIGLVVLGLANVWQLQMVQTGAGVADELRTLGSDRLMWGTDMPNVERFCNYRQTLDTFRVHCLGLITDADIANIVGGTTARLFGLAGAS